jgi:hypothetical protein
MDRTIFGHARRFNPRILVLIIALGATSSMCAHALAGEEVLPPTTQPKATVSIHSDGVFNDTYFRQLQRPMTSAIERGGIPQANGWTSYGFPARSYHWGWFGAERHYPRVMWHQGYYGDQVRTAYRYAY